MSILNQTTKQLQQLDNIGLLSLFPSSAEFDSCFEIYRLEMMKLEKEGFQVERKERKEGKEGRRKERKIS